MRTTPLLSLLLLAGCIGAPTLDIDPDNPVDEPAPALVPATGAAAQVRSFPPPDDEPLDQGAFRVSEEMASDLHAYMTWGGNLNLDADGAASGTLAVNYLDGDFNPQCSATFSHGGSWALGLDLIPGCPLCQGAIYQQAHDGPEAGCPWDTAMGTDPAVWDAVFETRGLLAAPDAADGITLVGVPLYDLLGGIDIYAGDAWVLLDDLGAMFEGITPDASDELYFSAVMLEADLSAGGSFDWFAFYAASLGGSGETDPPDDPSDPVDDPVDPPDDPVDPPGPGDLWGLWWQGSLAVNDDASLEQGLEARWVDEAYNTLCSQQFAGGASMEMGLGLVPGCDLCDTLITSEPLAVIGGDCPDDDRFGLDPASWDALVAQRGLIPWADVVATGLTSPLTGIGFTELGDGLLGSGTTATHLALDDLGGLLGDPTLNDVNDNFSYAALIYAEEAEVAADGSLAPLSGWSSVYAIPFGAH